MTAPARHRRPPVHRGQADTMVYPGITGEDLRVSMAVAPLDRAAIEMDRKYGIDRLPSLVSPATAEKYGRAMAFLNDSIRANDPDKCAAAAANCIKGLAAMDAEAVAMGRTPMPPVVWEYELDGRHIGIIRDTADWEAAQAALPGATIHTLREVAVALAAYGAAGPAIEAVKQAFPGAQVSAVRPRSQIADDLDDEIPF